MKRKTLFNNYGRGTNPPKPPKPPLCASAGSFPLGSPKNTPKRLASWRAARAGKARSYRVWVPHSLIGWFIERGDLTVAQAGDPDRVAEVLAAALMNMKDDQK